MYPDTVLARLRELVLSTPVGQLLDQKQALVCNGGGSHHMAKRLASIARADGTIVLECAPGRRRGWWRRVNGALAPGCLVGSPVTHFCTL